MTTFTTPTRHTDRAAGLHYAETPVRQRAVLTCGSWRRVTRRIVCGLTCALTVSSLLMPSISFAAEWVEVDGNTYTAGATAGDGSTWAWDGADNMTLNGYNGGGIAAYGKLNVSYEGNNTVANDEGDGISVVDGANEGAELNISGTGTLTATAEGNALYSEGDMTISGTGTVTAKGAGAEGILADGDITITGGGTVDARSEQDCGIVAEETLTVSNSTLTAQGFGSGIYAFDGLTIDAATVRAYAYPAREDSPTAIFTDEGDITIKNGSFVHAYAEGENASGIYSYNYDTGSPGGRIFISDSTVEAIAHYINHDGGNQPLPPIGNGDIVVVDPDVNARTYGIFALTEDGLTPATISITRSRVTAEGDTAAILAVVNSADGSIAGTINIVDSIIETPNGGRICDVRFVDTEPADAPYQRGQTIGTASDVITDLYSDAIAKRAVIVPVDTPPAKPESKPKVTTAAATIKHVDTKGTLAATGDASAMGAVAAVITGMAAVVAGIFTSRKRS
ncbi:carbohydrate-binding domain-containing protein [Collinsella aerofaciens]|uniref:carbohydrate-binding domain-containing protein n=1 Tax=Collinsella aerofaciens TaxID=74426 RepID=UPI00359C142F